MSLIVEDGTGRADAESPQSVAAVDAYAALAANSSRTAEQAAAWLALDTAGKEQTARRATIAQECALAFRVSGWRKVAGQALSFPRFAGYDLCGQPYGDGIPSWWKSIHAELCMRDAADGLLADTERSIVTSFSVGSVGTDLPSYSETRDTSRGQGASYPFLEALGERYLRPVGETTW